MSTEEQIKHNVDELLQFMGIVNREYEGANIPEKHIDDSYPFKRVYESLCLIKQDFDSILSGYKRTEEALQQRNRELLLLNQAGQMFGSSLELEQVLDTVLGEIQRLLDVFSISFWMIAPGKNELTCLQAKGPGSEDLVHWRLPAGQGITGWAAQHGESVLVSDVLADERHVMEVDRQTGVPTRSMMSIPLQAKGKVIGVLNLVDQRVGHFTRDDLRFLEPIAAAAAIAIENAHLYTTAQQEIAERRRAEEALRASQQYANNIIDSSLDMIITVDTERKIVEFNKAAQKAFGYLPEEVVGKHIDILYANPGEGSTISQSTSKGQYVGEILNRRKNGEVFPCLLSASVLYGVHGKSIGAMGISRDITERKQAENLLRRLKKAVETTEVGVTITDKEGRIVYINPADAKMHGYTVDELIGQRSNIFAMPELRDHGTKTILDGQVFPNWKRERMNSRKDDTLFPVELISNPIQDENGELIGIVTICEDITERKRTEKELQNAKEQAESANRAKSEFIANMSHEIRTPMNAILGFSELLLNKIENPQHKDYLASIHSSGKALLDLINDILDLSKIEAGRLEIQPEPVNIKDVVDEITLMLDHRIREKGIAFYVEISEHVPERLVLDEIRIRQILINLLGNAIKFTEKGSVTLRVKSERGGGAEALTTNLQFEIEDTGIGIPDSQKALIFESFRQQDGQKTRKYGGTGLGLAITKKLVELMRGSITIESNVGKGSLFRVVLSDVEIVEKVYAATESSDSKDLCLEFEPATILVVDDIDYNRKLVKGYLEATNLAIIEASSAEVALELVGMEHPDLILMDLRMPGKSGYEATEILKNDDEFKQIPVIALTATAMKGEEARINALFDGYLRKPVKRRQLLSELKRFVGHKTETTEDIRRETSKHAERIVSKEVNARLPEMLDILETSFMPRWNELAEMLMMDDVEAFAVDLKDIAQEYTIQSVIDYSKNLYEQTRSYSVDAVENLIAAFPGVVASIKDQFGAD